jgi:hypothetical protein
MVLADLSAPSSGCLEAVRLKVNPRTEIVLYRGRKDGKWRFRDGRLLEPFKLELAKPSKLP